MPPDLLRRCLVLAGPTACGKTAAGIALCRRVGGEVLSMDSMAVYRGMEVGTAKPTADERAAVPHHLLDLADPHETFTVADWLAAAEDAAADVLGRGRVPVFAGGTAFYLRSLLRGLAAVPPGDPALRADLEADAAARTPQVLHAELAAVDPAAAAKIYPQDARRIVRAWEVIRLTGKKFSDHHAEGEPRPPADRPRACVWLDPPRTVRWARIHARIDRMLADGLVDEVRRLAASPRGLTGTARQALGYKEILAHLNDGVPLADCVEQLRVRTRQFSKRQCTFFRGMEECERLGISGEETAGEVAGRVFRS